MEGKKSKLVNFFFEDDFNENTEEEELAEVESFFTQICININNMTASSINLGNNSNCKPSPNQNSSTSGNPRTSTNTGKPQNLCTSQKRCTNYNNKKEKFTPKIKKKKHVGINTQFPGMIYRKTRHK